MADSSQLGISLTVRPGSHAILIRTDPGARSLRPAIRCPYEGRWPAAGRATGNAPRVASGIGCCLRVVSVISIAY